MHRKNFDTEERVNEVFLDRDEESSMSSVDSDDEGQTHTTAYKAKRFFQKMGRGLKSFGKRLGNFSKNKPFLAAWIVLSLLTTVAIVLAVTVPPVGGFFAGLLIGSAKLVGASALVGGLSAVQAAAIGAAIVGAVVQIANAFLSGVAKLFNMAAKAIKTHKARNKFRPYASNDEVLAQQVAASKSPGLTTTSLVAEATSPNPLESLRSGGAVRKEGSEGSDAHVHEQSGAAPGAAPDAAPVEAPVEAPAAAPAEDPVEDPVEDPAAAPVAPVPGLGSTGSH